jgi:hypothetical protein
MAPFNYELKPNQCAPGDIGIDQPAGKPSGTTKLPNGGTGAPSKGGSGTELQPDIESTKLSAHSRLKPPANT